MQDNHVDLFQHVPDRVRNDEEEEEDREGVRLEMGDATLSEDCECKLSECKLHACKD